MPLGGVAVEADHVTAELLQLGQRAREVLHQRDRHVLERARGRLGQRAVERRAVAARHDEAGRAEHRRRAQDGADVVRVGHLVEHDDGPAGAVSASSASVGSGSGSASIRAPWCTVSAPSRRSRSRGSTRSCASCRAARASAAGGARRCRSGRAWRWRAAGWRAPPPPRGCRRSGGGHSPRRARAAGAESWSGGAVAVGSVAHGAGSGVSSAAMLGPIAVDRDIGAYHHIPRAIAPAGDGGAISFGCWPCVSEGCPSG